MKKTTIQKRAGFVKGLLDSKIGPWDWRVDHVDSRFTRDYLVISTPLDPEAKKTAVALKLGDEVRYLDLMWDDVTKIVNRVLELGYLE